MNIFLIGMMGAGKTSVGEALSRKAGCGWFDLDTLYEERYGSIAKAFAEEGENVFRAREKSLLEEICAAGFSECVISTGGGTILDAKNREILRVSGTAVWLRAGFSVLWERVRSDREPECLGYTRPLAQDREAFFELFAQREPAYRACADVVVDTGKKPVDQIADALCRRFFPKD